MKYKIQSTLLETAPRTTVAPLELPLVNNGNIGSTYTMRWNQHIRMYVHIKKKTAIGIANALSDAGKVNVLIRIPLRYTVDRATF